MSTISGPVGPHNPDAVTLHNHGAFSHGLHISDHSTTNHSIHQTCRTCEGCVCRSHPTLASEETANEVDSGSSALVVDAGAAFASPEDEGLWVDLNGAADDLQCGPTESLFCMEVEPYYEASILSDYETSFTGSSTAYYSGGFLPSRWLTLTPDSCRALPASWAAMSNTTGNFFNTNEAKLIQSRSFDALPERRTTANSECHDRSNHTLETSRSLPMVANPDPPHQTDGTLDPGSTSIFPDQDTVFALGSQHLNGESSKGMMKQTSGSMESPGSVCTDQCSSITHDGTSISSSPSVISEGERSFISAALPWPCFDTGIVEALDSAALTAGFQMAQDFLQSMSPFIQRPNNAHCQDSQPSSSSCSSSRHGSSSQPTTPKKRTSRATTDASDDDTEDEDIRKRPLIDQLAQPLATALEMWACPYAKQNPIRYSQSNTLGGPTEKRYRKCSSIYLTTIGRVKQHLYRVHRRPKNYCKSCFKSFQSDAEVSQHERMRACLLIECPFEEKMNPDQYTLVKRRRMKEDKTEAWFAIFRVLLPGHPLPESAHVTCPTPLSSDVCWQTVAAEYNAFIGMEAPKRLAPLAAQRLFGDDYSAAEEMFVGQVVEQTLPYVLHELEAEFRLLKEAS